MRFRPGTGTNKKRDSFHSLHRNAAAGVDGVTWRESEKILPRRVTELHRLLHAGAYRATPSRRVYIPKANGRQRPAERARFPKPRFVSLLENGTHVLFASSLGPCASGEITLEEIMTHPRRPRMVLRGKTPELVRQEFHGLLMAHFAIRGLLHEAAVEADEDPDRFSYLHAVRVVRRRPAQAVAIPSSGQTQVS